MEITFRDFIVKFKSLILAVIALGVMMYVVSYLLDPNQEEQILNTLNNLGGLFIILPFILILFFFVMKEMTKLNR